MIAALALALTLGLHAQAEIVADIQIHGNVLTSEDDILKLAGIQVGMPFAAGTVNEVAERLRTRGRFQRVDVQKRFASIADASQITVVILVDEGPVKVQQTGDPAAPVRLVRGGGARLLFGPVFELEDGYGLTYGVRVARPAVVGRSSRLSFPLTWGGTRRAAAELEFTVPRGPVNRIVAGGGISRRDNKFYDEDDDRRRVWVRAERTVLPMLRTGVQTGFQRVNFAQLEENFPHLGVDVVLDTRHDPLLARNAVFARAAWERFGVAGGAVTRTDFDVRGYLGMPGQNVLVGRALTSHANRAAPPYLQPLLGGMTNLRGFRTGSCADDNLAAGSIELRVPLTSPMSVGKLGVSAFVDFGTVYSDGERLADQKLERGTGGSVWFSAAFFRVGVAVARAAGGSTRVHVGTGLAF